MAWKKEKETHMMFMNCRSKDYKLVSVNIQGVRMERKKRTHDKVDPKIERVRGVEGWASDEPFGAKRHPPVNVGMHDIKKNLPR